ncbi:NINE protein [Caloramator proteoclasticus]|uniref:TM2 domain-containing protein n=1 Tax=Caloramator proteoclasticus DSM 10124 TaxID=1121262 RepID=A0A1M5C8D7_9CLOT|nr:NINE protein [Caloramator proteoclasticus]SHF51019.1 TM2 domain-containing protein [Caloramator proteoclasticus DSM 10124]
MNSKKMKLFIICLFTGFLGGHYFVIGKFKRGFLYFFTFGLFGFGWFYDLIQILIKDDFTKHIQEKDKVAENNKFETVFVHQNNLQQQQYNENKINLNYSWNLFKRVL